MQFFAACSAVAAGLAAAVVPSDSAACLQQPGAGQVCRGAPVLLQTHHALDALGDAAMEAGRKSGGSGVASKGAARIMACEDTDQSCSGYDRSFCDASSEYAPWMRSNCQKYCGFCGSSGPAATPAPSRPVEGGSCQDKDQGCSGYSSQYCQASSEFYAYMQEHCQRTCGFCGGQLPGPSPTPAPGPTPPPSLSGAGSYQEILDRHNKYRCMHGVPLLSWSAEIAQNAQAWADETGGEMRHGPTPVNIGGYASLGENLHGYTDAQAVDGWYDEIGLTSNGLVSSYDPSTGHYTAVVWKSTSALGCGTRGQLLVCQYGEGGNVAGGFASNVFSPSVPESQC